MTLSFFEPPPHQRIGGLELAVGCLRSYLLSNGVAVENEPNVATNGSLSGNRIAHFHGLWQPRFLRISRYCRSRNIPYVVSPHGMLEPWAWKHKAWKKWPYFLLFERRHLAGAARLLATSEMEASNLRKSFPRAHCTVIPLGLPEQHQPDYPQARKELGWSETERVLLFLSRVHPKKGLHLLLEALETVDDSVAKSMRLVVIGGGEDSYVQRMRSLALRLQGRLGAVDWLGEIWGDKKWRFLQGADLFCLPSFSENFSLAVLEALQTGTRALVTNTCPWDFLEGWKAGFVVEPAVAAIRKGLQAFTENVRWTEVERDALAVRVREKFGWQTVGPMYLNLYQTLIETRSQQRAGHPLHAS